MSPVDAPAILEKPGFRAGIRRPPTRLRVSEAETGPVAEIRPLTGLRGFAVLIVFLSHAANEGMLPAWMGLGTGQMGVQLFFALSGLLMVHLYAPRVPTRQALIRFATARVARVVPLYLLVVFASALIGLADPAFRYAFADGWGVLAALLFLTAPEELWSIPVEVQFYALFPLVWLTLRAWRWSGVAMVSVSLCLALLAKLMADGWMWLPLYAHVFLLGGMLAPLVGRQVSGSWGGWVLAAGVAVVFLSALPGIRGWEIFTGFYPSFWLDPHRVAANMVCLAFAASGGVAASWIFGNRPLCWLGRLSFGIYVFHRPILQLFSGSEWGLPPVLGALLAGAATLGLAVVSFHAVERPVGRLVRAWGDRQSQQSRPARSHAAERARSQEARETPAREPC